MSMVITGAAGQLGRRTAELVLDRVEPAEVILVTRRPEELADLAARGASVRFGDFDDPGSLAAAFAGATRLLMISTDAVGRRIAQHANAIEAAQAAGVAFVAYTSIPNPVEANPALVAAEHRMTEERLRASGLQWTFLRNALYSEFRIPEAQAAVAQGSFRHNQGDGHTAYVSREDCAAAAAAVLTGGDEHTGRGYDITGPELLSAPNLARLYGGAGGAAVTAVALDDDAYVTALVDGAGLPAEVATLVASFGTAIRVGALDQCSGDVETLTGRAPRSVAKVLEGASGALARSS